MKNTTFYKNSLFYNFINLIFILLFLSCNYKNNKIINPDSIKNNNFEIYNLYNNENYKNQISEISENNNLINENIKNEKVNSNLINNIDYDFTKMNYNMISAITFEMLVEPESYINKTVKISGNFASSIHEGKRSYAVILWDVTGCCPTGLNFEIPETMKFPEDFPEIDDEITVTGTMRILNLDGEDALYFVAEEIVF